MEINKIKEKLIDLLWHDSEKQYYSYSEHSFLDNQKSLYAFNIDQLSELMKEAING